VSRGCLRGRPFGGVAMFVNNRLADVSRLVTASTRYIIVQVGQVVLINVYLPRTTTPCRNEEFIDCLANILYDISNLQYTHYFWW